MGDYLAWFERGHNTVHIIYKSYGIEGEKLQTFTLASH